jgi:hypothetical protein
MKLGIIQNGNFVFHRVIWEEINGCIGSGRFAEYVDFKDGRLSNYEKVKETYTSVTFVCGVELYVCVYLVYVFVDEAGFVRLVSYTIYVVYD